jgi:hypothetical protein
LLTDRLQLRDTTYLRVACRVELHIRYDL